MTAPRSGLEVELMAQSYSFPRYDCTTYSQAWQVMSQVLCNEQIGNLGPATRPYFACIVGEGWSAHEMASVRAKFVYQSRH